MMTLASGEGQSPDLAQLVAAACAAASALDMQPPYGAYMAWIREAAAGSHEAIVEWDAARARARTALVEALGAFNATTVATPPQR